MPSSRTLWTLSAIFAVKFCVYLPYSCFYLSYFWRCRQSQYVAKRRPSVILVFFLCLILWTCGKQTLSLSQRLPTPPLRARVVLENIDVIFATYDIMEDNRHFISNMTQASAFVLVAIICCRTW